MSDIANILGGFAFKSNDLGSQGYPVVKIAEIEPPIVNTRACQRVLPERVVGLDRFRLKNRDIVMAMTGHTTGKVGRVLGDEIAFLNQRVAKISAKAGSQFDDFVYAVVSQTGFDAIVRNNAAGSAQPNVSTEGIGRITIPDFSPEDQLRIGRTIAALDDKVELNRKMSATLEAMARTLFKSWFVDFDPVRARAEGSDPGLPPKIAALFPDSFEYAEIGKIPRGWRVVALSDCLTELEVGSRPKGGVSRYAAGVPSIGAESIVGLGVFDYSKTKFIPHEFFAQMSRGKVKSRDVLLYKDGGRPGQFEPHIAMFGNGFPFSEYAINEHVYRLRADRELSQAFLYFWLSSEAVVDEMRIKGTGVAVPGLNSTEVRSLKTLVPPMAVVRAFDSFAEPLVSRVLTCANESRTLGRLRGILLPKFISGEMRVSDAERLVEAFA